MPRISRAVRELYEKASVLPPEDRAELAGLLSECLGDQRDPNAEEAWAREIERRMADYRAGRIRTIPWQELVPIFTALIDDAAASFFANSILADVPQTECPGASGP